MMKKMLEIRCCFVELCVLCLLVQVAPGTEIVTKSVCSGDSVPMFEIDKKDASVSLYMNHEIHTLMAIWHMNNSTITSRIQEEYKEKVFLDEYRTIWIRNVNHWDEENYFIEYDIGTLSTKSELKLHVRVAPNRNCKPKINNHGKILTASLNVEDCGIPVASLHWLDYPGLSNTSEPVIDLPPGKEVGTYYACIRGPALECAKISNLSDYCSSYTVGGNDIQIQSSDLSDLKTAIYVMASTIIVIISAHFSFVVITCALKIRRRKNFNRREAKPLLQDLDSRIKYIKKCDPEQTNPSQDNRQLWIDHFDDLKWKDIMALLNTGQKQDLQIYCDSLHKTEDASVEDHTCTGPARSNPPVPVIEPRDDALCKICFVNRRGVSFLPCGHMTTCIKCSVSLQECPVCRAKITAQVKPFSLSDS